MKLYKFYAVLILLLIFSCSKEKMIDNEVANTNPDARVVGYLPEYRFNTSNQLEYCKLTHLNLAFANPDSSGKLIINDFSHILTKARNQNSEIKIYISIGGGSLSELQSSVWSDLIDNSENRSLIIKEIVDFVINNDLDGVDVDLEWGNVTSGYSPFVIGLKESLTSNKKGMTAAFPGTTRFENITDEAIQNFDFINIMAYDFTGPWNPTNSGQHSSYNNSVQSIEFWTNSVGISGTKLTLGVPFYGYDFTDSSNITSFTYGSIVSAQSTNSELDNVGMKFYNGRLTIKSKVKLASEKVSGIMIWELGQDSFSEFSLLKTIHNQYKDLGYKTTSLCLD
jgi:GH18 family chitinase